VYCAVVYPALAIAVRRLAIAPMIAFVCAVMFAAEKLAVTELSS
jgi:hypothetical protein